MNINKPLICQQCNAIHFQIKREATYLYTYNIDTPLTHKWSKEDEVLPFLFDKRELLNGKEYLECLECGSKYPCKLDNINSKIYFTISQKAIRSDLVKTPEFLG